MPLRLRDMRDRRPVIFLAILLLHMGAVLYAVYAARPLSSLRNVADPLVLLLLPRAAREPAEVMLPNPVPLTHPGTPSVRAPKPNAPDDALQVTPDVQAPPTIDWEHEAEITAQNASADAEKQKNYRDLSSLTTAQLDWINKNHLEPAPPGFHWSHHRVEFNSKTGVPIIWINEYCVLIGVLPFCRWGKKIEPDGTLFEHMRDPHEP